VEVRRLITLAPDNFWHMVQGYDLAGWRFTGAPMMSPIASQVLLPSEVIHSRAPNPYLYWRGLSPLVVAMLPAAADYAAEQFMKGLMLNNADTGLLITMMKQPTDEQRAHVLAALRERKRSAGTADRPLFLWGGARVEKPQVSSADLQFLENRKFTRSEICAAFGVPEEVLTATDHSKYDVMAGARLNFIENRVAPFCRRLEAEEEAAVKAIDPRATGWFDIEALPIMQEALRKRLLSAKVGFDMGVPLNHLNRLFDLGFPSLPWGNVGYLPSKYQLLPPSPPESQSQS
jgi:phage portal protein BeeE